MLFPNSWLRVRERVSRGQVYVILDVDRTIYNTTVWYHACARPGLLIAPENAQEFHSLNDESFPSEGGMSQPANRDYAHLVLKLLEPAIGVEFSKIVAGFPEWSGGFVNGQLTDASRLYAAGYITAKQLHSYSEAAEYLSYCHRLYGRELRVLFLSKGLHPFIRGVVEEFIERHKLSYLNYEVCGSDVNFTSGAAVLGTSITPGLKEAIVGEIAKTAAIALLADDSDITAAMASHVQQAGGKALPISHATQQERSSSWVDLIRTIGMEALRCELATSPSKFSLDPPSGPRPHRIQLVADHADEVGIVGLSQQSFDQAVEGLCARINDYGSNARLRHALEELAYLDAGVAKLRGRLYFYWVPPYVFADARPIVDRWSELIQHAYEGLKILSAAGIFKNNSPLSAPETLLVFAFLDHLVMATVTCLHVVESASVNAGVDAPELLSVRLESAVEAVYELMYGFLLTKDTADTAAAVCDDLPFTEIVAAFQKYSHYHRGMRELDDTVAIYDSVKLIAERWGEKAESSYVLSFPYGGIELGFALRAILKWTRSGTNGPHIIHCHYSSKKELRGECAPINYDDDDWLFSFVPRKHRVYLERLRQGGSDVLLYDHNVTTFETLRRVSDVCRHWHNQTSVAVVSVNYENMARYLCGGAPAEGLAVGWRQMLDYPPVQEYISAFNTWKTCNKSKHLERTYFRAASALPVNPAGPLRKGHEMIFKVCRVHNAVDLATVTAGGTNMIGIHCVYDDELSYLKKELRLRPVLGATGPDGLPLPFLEIASIQSMQRVIPQGMKQALVFERTQPLAVIDRCAAELGLRLNEHAVQFQHRVTTSYLDEVRTKTRASRIATIGLNQPDFGEYFRMLQSGLGEHDLVLLDMSNHQPDWIGMPAAPVSEVEKRRVLYAVARSMSRNSVGVLLADDGTVEHMTASLEILASANVRVAGIDMQNCLELPTHEQSYRMISVRGRPNQARIRKSGDAIRRWRSLIGVRASAYA